MVANLGDREPPAARRGASGRRRRRRRESPLVWWAAHAAVAAAAWLLHSWRLALIGLLFWCLYELLLVPTICRVTTRQGFSCREPVRGRLFACASGHQRMKTDGLWRLFGLRGPGRKRTAREDASRKEAVRTAEDGASAGRVSEHRPGDAPPSGDRETGVVVVSPEVRGRLAQADRALILLALAGTAVTVAGMVYGFVR